MRTSRSVASRRVVGLVAAAALVAGAGLPLAGGRRQAPLRAFQAHGGGLADHPVVGIQDRRFTTEQTARRTVALPVGRAGRISIENLSGDITITAADRSDVAVSIVKRARGRTAPDAARGLDEVRVEVEQRDARATIEVAGATRNAPYAVDVSFTIEAPAGTAFRVETLAGDVSASGLTGALSLASTAGDVTVRDAAQVEEVSAVAGSIRLISVGARSRLDAETLAGSITAERITAPRLRLVSVSGNVAARGSTVDQAELRTTTGSVEFAGTVAARGRYELQSQSGDVTFTATGGSGFELRASTFAGSIRPATGLGLAAPRRPRRELRGTVGDGRAVVVLTSFSGDISISR